MKNRKRIAVIMCDVDYYEYQHRILDGLISQAFALNYDVAIVTAFTNHDDETDYQFGENQVFSLIDYHMFDAVIYAPCSIVSLKLKEKLEKELLSSCPLPVVAMESTDPGYHAVNVDDRQAFEHVVSHIIEKHNLENILCLTGFQGNLQAEERLQGYRNAMAKHGITVKEENVIYGDFWTPAALELAQEIADGKRAKPDAVVCVSDTVAITLCNRLIELGFRVPEDIIVVGYDFSQDSADNVPTITSYVRPLANMGMQAVIKVHQLLTGDTAVPVSEEHGYLVPAESCGCGHDFQQKFTQRQTEIKESEYYRRLFENCSMAETLNACASLNQCLGKVNEHLYLINHMKDFYLCLCDKWDDFSKNQDDTGSYKYYTDTMHVRVQRSNDCAELVDVPFPKTDLLPIYHEDRDKPKAFYITPLHFNERCFGYCALGYGEASRAFDMLYHSWMRNVNNALEFVRVRNIFNSMNQRLFMASIRDTLTGIFNRKGFRHHSQEVFEKAKTSGKRLLVVAADLDCLKVINDTYGHLEGDHAISIVANALNSCFEYGEICARTGGDEFLVIGCADYTDEKIEQYMEHIQRFFARYNSTSEKPYAVEASIGYVCREVQEGQTLQEFLDAADARMYENKVIRKKNRR